MKTDKKITAQKPIQYSSVNKSAFSKVLFIMLIALLLMSTLSTASIIQSSNNITYAESTESTSDSKNTDNGEGNTKDDIIAPYDEKLPEYEELKTQNEDFVGWLIVKGTKVDYPVMQTKDDPHFYLYKDFNKNYLYEGTLFINENSDMDEPSDVVFVYGHNMKNGNQFGEFDLFLDQDYLKDNNQIILDSLTERREFEITHILRVRVNVPEGDPFPYYSYDHFEDEADFDEFVAQCEKYEIYDTGETLEYGDKFVMMTTCEYTWADGTGRIVVMGKDITDEKEEVITKEAIQTEPVDDTPWVKIITGSALSIIFICLIVIGFIRNRLKLKKMRSQ